MTKKDNTKRFFIRAEVGEGYPDYEFVVKAINHEKANEIVKEILSQDYPEVFCGKYAERFSCDEVTAEQLLERLTLN